MPLIIISHFKGKNTVSLVEQKLYYNFKKYFVLTDMKLSKFEIFFNNIDMVDFNAVSKCTIFIPQYMVDLHC